MTAEPMHENDGRNVVPLRRRDQAPRLFKGDVQEVEYLEDEDVLEGEVVDEEVEWSELPALHRAAVVVRETVTSDAARAAARQASYLVVGAQVTRRRWKDRRGGRYERMMSAAEAMGDHEAVMKWAEMAAQASADRHSRRMERAASWGRHVERLPTYAKASAGTLGGLGVLMAVASKDATMVAAPFLAIADAVQWAIYMFTILWGPALVTAPLVALLGLWATGRSNLDASNLAWVQALNPAAEGEGEPITPSIVVTALRDLGVPALRKAVADMGDAGAAMLGPIRIAGPGVQVDVKLPSGTSTKEVQDRRRKLAENLGRFEHEVFITLPKEARTVRLWIADSGALDEPIGPSPLVLDPDMRANYKTGRAPWGENLRSEPIGISLYQRHLLITGLSNQGKTASLRALALWLALDPRVRFSIGDLKGAGDWSMFTDLAEVLIQGPTDEHVIDVTEMLEDAVTEMEKRLLSPPGTTFEPLIVIVDEAQVAFMCPAKGEDGRPYGGTKATSRYFMAARKLHNQGRAVDVILWEGTQDPTDANLPKLVREGAHTRASLAVGTEAQSRMALGDKAVDGGASPHLLRQGLDKGTVVVASDGIDIPAGESSITVRTHYINDDEATQIAERAKALRGAIATRSRAQEIETPRDLLEDLNKVLEAHTDRVRLPDVASWLRDLAPNYGPYAGLTGTDLAAKLDGYGIKTTNTGNVLRLDPKAFRAGLERAATQSHTTE